MGKYSADELEEAAILAGPALIAVQPPDEPETAPPTDDELEADTARLQAYRDDIAGIAWSDPETAGPGPEAPESAPEPPTEPVTAPAIPEALQCTHCGERYVEVVLTWLQTAEVDLACSTCYLSTATAIVLRLAEDAPTE